MTPKEGMGLLQKHLGVPVTGAVDVDETTAKALAGVMQRVVAKYPQAAQNNFVSPYIFDTKALKFLTEVATAEMQANRLSPDVSAAYNTMQYITQGKLPDGTNTLKPVVSTPWQGKKQNDLFFNIAVYNELGIDLKPHNPGKLDMRGVNGTVSYKALFNPENADPEQQAIIKQAAKSLNIQPIDPKAAEHRYRYTDVQRMATEILAIQARKVCAVSHDSQITDAIMNFRYMPHLADMKLAEQGFGAKLPWNMDKFNHYKDIRLIPANADPNDPSYDVHRIPEVTAHQSQQWAKRFGGISEDRALEIAKLKVTWPTGHVRDDYGHQQTALDWIKETHQSPHSYFGLPYHTRKSKFYENVRENIYLPELGWKIHNGMSYCSAGISAAPATQQPATAAPTSGTSNAPCRADSVDSSCSKPAAPSCRADSADSFSCGGSGAANAIRDNSRSATGSGTKPPCAADSLAGSCSAPKPLRVN